MSDDDLRTGTCPDASHSLRSQGWDTGWDMRYGLRKLGHHWTVCVGEAPVLECTDFGEAFPLAWNAAIALNLAQSLARRACGLEHGSGDPAPAG